MNEMFMSPVWTNYVRPNAGRKIRTSPRPISMDRLNMLPYLNVPPINLVVCKGTYSLEAMGNLVLRTVSHLDAFSVYPFRMRLPCRAVGLQQVHRRFVHPGPLVLRTDPLKFPTPTTDRDRTVSRRSEPSSRTTLMDEQSNPWELLHPQDVMSRHRGAKLRRRCERLGEISLLSPG